MGGVFISGDNDTHAAADKDNPSFACCGFTTSVVFSVLSCISCTLQHPSWSPIAASLVFAHHRVLHTSPLQHPSCFPSLLFAEPLCTAECGSSSSPLQLSVSAQISLVLFCAWHRRPYGGVAAAAVSCLVPSLLELAVLCSLGLECL